MITEKYPLDKIVNVLWFGLYNEMKVIGHSLTTNEIEVQHLDARGSFFVDEETLDLYQDDSDKDCYLESEI